VESICLQMNYRSMNFGCAANTFILCNLNPALLPSEREQNKYQDSSSLLSLLKRPEDDILGIYKYPYHNDMMTLRSTITSQ